MFHPDEKIIALPERSILSDAAGAFARRIFIATLAEPEYPGNTAFLTKILAAAQLNLEQDTMLAEIPTGSLVSLLPALREKQAEHILVFGLTPEQVGLNLQVEMYQPVTFYGAIWLFAETLSALEPDKTRKGLLWRALQQMFLA